MQPEHYPYWFGAIMVAALGFFLKYHFTKFDNGLTGKADKSEVLDLRKELRESQEARERDLREASARRERDMERMERLGNERYAQLQVSINQRFADLEKHFDQQIQLIIKAVEKR